VTSSTKDRLLEAGLAMLLERGYNHLGILDVLAATGVPKGSFYHHFESKEDFGLQVIDRYMDAVHAGLDQCLGNKAVPPLRRVRDFFEATREKYREEGYLGCLLGGLGQELAGVSELFRRRIEGCFQEIAERIAGCIEEAIATGELSRGTNARQLANLLVDCWEACGGRGPHARARCCPARSVHGPRAGAGSAQASRDHSREIRRKPSRPTGLFSAIRTSKEAEPCGLGCKTST
jgi:TetR/AcrR family transcriptional regulator, transcriptional repressor for nem operon